MIIILLAIAILLMIIGFACMNKYTKDETATGYLRAIIICWLSASACIVASILLFSNSVLSDCSCDCPCCEYCHMCSDSVPANDGYPTPETEVQFKDS